MSKMGISVISSYRGGYNFEALGLSRALVADYFPGMSSRISGLGLAGLEENALVRHEMAFDEDVISLPVGGFYRLRAKDEPHALDGGLIHTLQSACNTGDYSVYRKFADELEDRAPIQLRDLLDFKHTLPPVPLTQVQSINEIRKRFVTPGMSLGALSPEAHGTLNIAMNRIGAKSVSGEGGEDRALSPAAERRQYELVSQADRVRPLRRDGGISEPVPRDRDQGGPRRQARRRRPAARLQGDRIHRQACATATPGVTLISPPPHHDIYSIEDLAQLIYDLKQINPDARGSV